jgi:hypothetical protein
MHMFLKREGARKGTLAGAGGQKGGIFGESTGPVDNELDMFVSAIFAKFLCQAIVRSKSSPRTIPNQRSRCYFTIAQGSI